MPTAAEIERIAALVERLVPLASRQRGQLIEAEQWNTMVGAVLEVARALIAQDERAAPPHDHPDQVTAGWLDPSFRARLERGALADPSDVARVAKVERRVDGLRRSLDAVAGDVAVVRTATSRVEVSDLSRASSITRLTRQIDGLGDARDDVAAVRETLNALRTDLDRVTTFARDLEVDGQTTTVAGLVERLDSLEQLRSRLTAPDGSELNATTLEVRLAELQTALVTEEELTAALGNLPTASLPDSVREELLGAATLAAREQAEASTADLATRLDADISTRLAGVESAATAAAATRADEAVSALGDSLRTTLGAEQRAGDDAVRSELATAVADLRTEVSGDLDTHLAALDEQITARIDAGIGELGAGLTAELRTTVEALQQQMAPLAAGIDELRRTVQLTAADVAGLRTHVDTSVAALGTALRTEIATASAQTRAAAVSEATSIGAGIRSEIAAERLRVDRAINEIRRFP